MTEEEKVRHIRREDIFMYIAIPLLTIGTVLIVAFAALPGWLRATVAVPVALLGAAGVVFRAMRWLKTYRLCFVSLVVLFVLAIIYLFLEQTGFMSIFSVPSNAADRGAAIAENMRGYLESKGQWATMMYILLQFLQTTILPLPAFAITGAGTLLFTQQFGPIYGPLYNSAMSFIGIVAGSLVSFFIGRRYGYKLVAWIVGRESLKKALLMLRGKDTVVLTLMFVLPFFPDDILCFVAGLSSMSTWYYIVMMTVSRLLVVFSTSYMVGLIPLNTWWGIATWGALIVVTLVAFFFAFKKGDRIDAFFRKKFHSKRRAKPAHDFDFAQEIIDKLDNEIREEQEAMPPTTRQKTKAALSGQRRKK